MSEIEHVVVNGKTDFEELIWTKGEKFFCCVVKNTMAMDVWYLKIVYTVQGRNYV